MNQRKPNNFYKINIKGHLQEKWAEWFNGMIVELTTSNQEMGETVMLIMVPDQAALRGVLNKIWDLNLSLISVTLIKDQ